MYKSLVSFFVLSWAVVGVSVGQTIVEGASAQPHVMYTTVGGTSTTTLDVRDVNGDPMTGTIEYLNTNPDRITINQDGTVTGLVVDSVDYKGTLIWALVDGDTLQHPANVKVLSQDYSFNYIEVAGEHTSLYYPTVINGLDLESLVAQYYYLDLLDRGHEVQQYLLNLDPNNGNTQIVTVEPEEVYDFRHCRNLEGVLRLTYDVDGGAYQNCFMIPYLPGQSPRTDVVYHEFGHAFQPELPIFVRSMGDSFIYVEAWANLMFTAVPQMFNERPQDFPLPWPAVQASRAMYDFKQDQQLGRFDDWLNDGAIHDDLNSNIVHGMILRHRGDRPVEFYQRYFYIFQNQLEPELEEVLQSVDALDSTGVNTFFAAHLGAVIRQDLSATFSTEYNYTIDQTLHDLAFDKITALLDASIFIGVEDDDIVLNNDSEFDVFPIPVSELASFRGTLGSSGQSRVDVYDLVGRRLISEMIESTSGRDVSFTLDMSDISPGVYFYRVERSGKIASGSIVVGR